MAGFNINQFKSNGLEYGGARPSLFEVFLTPPSGITFTPGSVEKFRFLCQGAELPAANIDAIDVPYFGRTIKVSGDRTFADWTTTVMNDEDFAVRSMFEKWSNSLNTFESNIRRPQLDGESSYKATLECIQYAKTGERIRAYEIVGAFPTAVDAISLGWETTNTIETFSVTFAYDYWLPIGSDEGNFNNYLGEATTPNGQ